ncbi:phosphatase PAP2 family protein [uncultured Alistipes sp.]|jgi:PAP2 superfamily|uniref:phosphatase PAP2 family protein n=1 Tax=uncultured Alistipes sp. TaxID=538949 RepID=UPI0025CE5BFC|nr:phosphatase PAP2 family protein [uncultured Alistipes sp.]
MIVGGALLSRYDSDFLRLRNGYARSFHHDYDDYLQYAPAALMVGMKAFGVRGRSSWGRMLVSDAFSAAVMAVAVNSLKYSFRVMRPDGTTRNSFPSGHTATAFMTATMLHKEYAHRSPWYSVGAYTLAAVTGITRQLNNRHWMSDVMVGAGIGILATELGYLLADLIFRQKGLNEYQMHIHFDRYTPPSFLGFYLGVTTVPGVYTPSPDLKTRFGSGPAVGVQGAWFASAYVGFGARFSVANLKLSVNDVLQDDNLESCSLLGGLYLSYPLSPRWLVGSKLLGGYERYKMCRTERCELGGRGGFALGTGVATTFRANRHLGVHLSADYDLAPPLVAGSRERLHKMTFNVGICAMF